MERRLSKSEWAVVGTTLLYMLAWLVVSLKVGNREFIFYLVVMCVLFAVATLVHLRVRFPLLLLWGLSLWGLAHMAGGLMPIPESWPAGGSGHVLYNWWLVPGYLKYDHLVHAYGFGLMTWLCWESLRGMFAGHGVSIQPSAGVLTLCAAGGMGFGAANELVEFIATVLVPETNVGGYENTGWDLCANFVGCLIAAALIRWSNSAGS